MLYQLHILIVVMSLAASYHAIGRQFLDKSVAEEILANGLAIFGFAIAALTAGNVEVPLEAGGTEVFASTALFWLWAALGFVNLLFVIVVPLEELMQSEGKSIWDMISRGNRP